MKKAERDEIFKNNVRFLQKLFKKRPEIIGIDLGTNITGFCYAAEKDNFALQKLIGGDGLITKRISNIRRVFTDLIQGKHISIRHRKLIAIIEDYSFSLRSSRLSQLAEIGGVIKNVLHDHRIPFVAIAPQTLKKFVLGPSRGKSAKNIMMVETLDKWGVKITDDNVCDAFCMMKFVEEMKEMIIGEPRFSKWKIDMFKKFIIDRGVPVSFR